MKSKSIIKQKRNFKLTKGHEWRKIGYANNGQPIYFCSMCGSYINGNGKTLIPEIFWQECVESGDYSDEHCFFEF